MKSVILAAGTGKRLGLKMPKCLLQINNSTIIENQINALGNCGISNIIVIVGFKSELVEKKCSQVFDEEFNIDFIYNDLYRSTNNLYSLWLAREKLNDSFLCLNGDIIFDQLLIRKLIKQRGHLCLAVDKTKKDSRVKLDGDLITELNKNIPINEADGEFIGVSKISKKGAEILFNELEKMRPEIIRKVLFMFAIQNLINRKIRIRAYRVEDFWFEFDSIEDIKNFKH